MILYSHHHHLSHLFRLPLFVLLSALCDAVTSSTTTAYEDKVTGTCSRPNLPPNARIRFTPPEKVKFAENETVYMLCEENQFPHHIQQRTCKHGQWQGPQARCGKAVSANVVKIHAFKCEDTHSPILNLNHVNQTEEAQYALPVNSFHFTRVKVDTVLSVFGSNCYRWIIKFERAVEIAFLLIDINMPKMAGQNDTPIVNVDITHRICKLQYTNRQTIENDEVFGNYFFCDLKTNLVNDTEEYNTEYLVMDVHTTTNRTVGLEAVFVGETYKKVIKKSNTTDCGRLEIQRTGVLEQTELGHTQVSCNESFIEEGGIKMHKFECNSNGLWQGSWPMCLPKKTCAKEDITTSLPSSIVIEQIGNVYYTNDTDWAAIDHTWVRYACANLDGIMVGKNDRMCSGGKWSNKIPTCTQATAIQQSSSTIMIIVGILVALIAVFSLIVYLSIKKIHRTLKKTKSELQASSQMSKQYSHSDYYTDLHGMDTIYEDINKDIYSVPLYELSDTIRYEAEPRVPLTEPEYLTMTEGISKSRERLQQRSRDSPEYSNY